MVISTFAFKLHGIKHLILHVPLSYRTSKFQEPICKCAFSVINVSNDAEIPYTALVQGHEFRLLRRQDAHDVKYGFIRRVPLMGALPYAVRMEVSPRSTRSTMPTIVASVGVKPGLKGNAASLEVANITTSPGPASIVSRATKGGPHAIPSAVTGITISIRCPTRRGDLQVDQILPITRPSFIH